MAATKEEIKELKNGTLAAELQAKTKELTSRIEEKEQAAGRLREKEIETGKKKGKLEEKIKALKERLDFLMKGYVPNDEIFAEVRSALETKSEAAYKKEMTVMAEISFGFIEETTGYGSQKGGQHVRLGMCAN